MADNSITAEEARNISRRVYIGMKLMNIIYSEIKTRSSQGFSTYNMLIGDGIMLYYGFIYQELVDKGYSLTRKEYYLEISWQ